MKQYFCVGTYTEPILFGTGQIFQGKGRGIYFCSFEDGKMEVLQCLELTNPSYFCVDSGYKKNICRKRDQGVSGRIWGRRDTGKLSGRNFAERVQR